jgi:hypothetical protein
VKSYIRNFQRAKELNKNMDYDNKFGYLPLTALAYYTLDDINHDDLIVIYNKVYILIDYV